MVVNSSPTARFKEHRRPNNTINPVCALGEQGRRITAIPVSASKGDQPALPPRASNTEFSRVFDLSRAVPSVCACC
jgi:hypothetical protein